VLKEEVEAFRRREMKGSGGRPEATARVLYLVAVEMNDRYRLKALRDFSLAKEELLSIRRAKYEASQTCLTQNS